MNTRTHIHNEALADLVARQSKTLKRLSEDSRKLREQAHELLKKLNEGKCNDTA